MVNAQIAIKQGRLDSILTFKNLHRTYVYCQWLQIHALKRRKTEMVVRLGIIHSGEHVRKSRLR